MDQSSAMYFVYAASTLFFLSASYLHSRSFIHPHFVFTTMLVYLLTADFLIRGYSHQIVSQIPRDLVVIYQLYILLFFWFLFASTWVLSAASTSVRLKSVLSNDDMRLRRSALLTAGLILLLEILKRLYFVDWSVGEMIGQSFGPRFGRSWQTMIGAQGGRGFALSLLSIVFPLSAVIFGFFAINKKGQINPALALPYALALLLLIGDGSRTDVILAVCAPTLTLILKSRSMRKKISMALFAGVFLISVTSLMVHNRDDGLLGSDSNIIQISYHQDDSYYRALWAIHVADTTGRPLDAEPFILAAFFNFIPRAFWTSKPLLMDDYFYPYKQQYITMTFIGDLVAIFGVLGGFIAAYAIGVLLFVILNRTASRAKSTTGLIGYVLLCLWVYMICRNLLNISQWMYMLGLFLLIVISARLTWGSRKMIATVE